MKEGGSGEAVEDGVDDADEDDGDLSPDMLLLAAAERGNVTRMRELLDRGANADAAISGDGSPLIAASKAGRLEAMAFLIDSGANVNRGVAGDGNPLLNAAREGHLEAVTLLLDRGADIDRGVPGDGNALIMAAGAGHLEVVRYLLEQGGEHRGRGAGGREPAHPRQRDRPGRGRPLPAVEGRERQRQGLGRVRRGGGRPARRVAHGAQDGASQQARALSCGSWSPPARPSSRLDFGRRPCIVPRPVPSARALGGPR